MSVCAVRSVVCAVGLVAFSTSTALAQCPIVEDQRFELTGAVKGDQFGFGVALDGEFAAVGSRGAGRHGENDHGTVYVYRRAAETWTFFEELHASDGEPHDQFGQTMAMRGDLLLIGAPGEDSGAKNGGAAYVFRFDGSRWVEEAKLLAPDAAEEDQFGLSVAIEGGIAVVGAPFDDEGADKTGAAFVYRYIAGTWTFEKKLIAGDSSPAPDQLGQSVAVAGDAVFAGAPLDNGPAFDSGAVYVFRDGGGTWTQEAKIVLGNAADGDELGNSLSALGDRVLAGAKGRNGDAGSVVFFVDAGAGQWNVEQEVFDGTPLSGARFGASVDLAADEAAVGATRDGDGTATTLRLRNGTWVVMQELRARASTGNDELGLAVALDGRRLVAGAPFFDRDATDTDIGQALFATSTDLTLYADPLDVIEGDDLELGACHGLPGGPVLLYAFGFGRILRGVFDGSGSWSLQGPVPPGTAGLSVTFYVIGLDFELDVEISNLVTVDIQ